MSHAPRRDGISRMTDIHAQVSAGRKAFSLFDGFSPLHALRPAFVSVTVFNGVPFPLCRGSFPDAALSHLEERALKNAAAQTGNFGAIVDLHNMDTPRTQNALSSFFILFSKLTTLLSMIPLSVPAG